ncbi:MULTISPECIES: bacterial transcriptional activator domain-containing protein [unclassified Duganella]|uniref:bacterial transcriptional activator domain-containing protein n=1 Tax=unclassified Duganella TaxID=2636909 RepID=UPI00088A9EAE|nr:MULTISPECIES: bacterial transcriptional activator domain-containing protein [unclassified Duganella]SDF93367.1 Tetratricopeptide repeat-containing protein [Duganella sp. OV458]SDJ11493.1 Tetratricopeptide repeat-containing protein [Duganella sp. OV510]
MMRRLLRSAALLAMLLPPLAAHAQDDGDGTRDLYRDALRSIAEGRRDDASDTLRRVIEQEPLHAGAWLDLALIQCALGHAAEAERLFRATEERFAPPPAIRELIAQSRAAGCQGWTPRSQYSITLARGIDQNVNQGADSATYLPPGSSDGGLVLLPDFLPQHDQYSLVSADYIRDLTPNGTQGFLLAQDRRNDTLSSYNSATLFAGVDTPWRYRDWKLRTTVTVGVTTLGGAMYQKQLQLQGQLTPPVPLPDTLQFSVTSGITHVDYQTLANFRGNTAELRGQLVYRAGNHYASASLGLLNDRASQNRPGGNRHGSSLALQWRWLLPAATTGELGYTRQTWQSQSAYAPGLIDQVRSQAMQVWRAGLTYPLTANQNLLVEVRRVQNQENISIFQYNDRQLQLSWQWLSP